MVSYFSMFINLLCMNAYEVQFISFFHSLFLHLDYYFFFFLYRPFKFSRSIHLEFKERKADSRAVSLYSRRIALGSIDRWEFYTEVKANVYNIVHKHNISMCTYIHRYTYINNIRYRTDMLLTYQTWNNYHY